MAIIYMYIYDCSRIQWKRKDSSIMLEYSRVHVARL